MTDARENPADASDRPDLSALVWPTVLSTAAAWASYRAAGPSFGAFLGTLILLAVIAPPISLAEVLWKRRALAMGGSVMGSAIVWAIVARAAGLSLGQWTLSVVVLAAWVVSLCGLAWGAGDLLAAARRGRISSGARSMVAGAVAVVAIGWLSWPVWTATWLRGTSAENTVGRLVEAHPLFALNAVLQPTIAWTSNTLIYSHVSLGRDVSFAMPAGVWASVGLHVALGAVGVGMAVVARRPMPRRADGGPCPPYASR